MKKIKDIVVVSHFALVRSELCDIINASTEYRAESFDWSIKRAISEKRGDEVLRIIDIDSFDKTAKEEVKDYIRAGIPAGTIFIIGTLDLKAVMQPPFTEKGFCFVTKMPGHLTENDRFRRNFFSALEKNGISVKQGAKPEAVSARASALKREAPGGEASASAQTPARPVMTRGGEIVRARDLRPERHLRVSLDSKGRIDDPNLIVAIASSTGGPKALQDMIPLISAKVNAPMIITQHMPAGFTKSMAERLDDISQIHVKEAEDGDILQKGWLYVAPGGKHLTIVPIPGGGHKAVLSDEAPVGGLKPCADIMYKSLETSNYSSILCVVLTGMGEDGSKGIVRLGEKKSIYVVSQDSNTCVVYGMPKAIAEVGYSDEVLPLLSIAKSIEEKVGVK